MNRDPWLALLRRAVEALEQWESGWGPSSLEPPTASDAEALDRLMQRLADNYPFGHPSYAGQMLKPPHPVAWVAYTVTQLINPNNHALDGGPATAALEREAVAELGRVTGFWSEPGLGHLSASGTVANLEALWVARQLHPGRAVAFSEQAHYTHRRMCEVLGLPAVPVPADAHGRLSVDGLLRAMDQHDIGTVVVTVGTTGLGALDPVHEVVDARSDLRVHADAAYGGFFSLLARRSPPLVDPRPFEALSQVDSLVVDPHKHGLQPYGCGAVLFRDATVGRFYRHDSPYTYFSSPDYHLGEITLECSRPGAAAAALWTTMQALPFEPERGLGAHLAAGRRAALSWYEALCSSPWLQPLLRPDSDIVVFAPADGRPTAASILSARSDALFQDAMTGPDRVYLAKIRLARAEVEPHWSWLRFDTDHVTVLRSVLMKPEHERWWPRIHARLEAWAKAD
jgi:glutamate/tyrosine decarboxylase-like PLP-dependent enzyme